jgi:hypothetical protein
MSKKFDLEAYKKTIKEREVVYKPQSFINVDECLQAVLGLPGIPRGHITQIYGKSDTGKTSLLFHLAAECQKAGELPIIYITEKKVDWDRAAAMGFDKKGYALVEESYETLEQVFDDILQKLAEQDRGELPKQIVFFWDSIGNTLSKDEFTDDKDGNREINATMMKAAKVIKGYMRHIGPKINSTRKDGVPHDASLVFLNQGYNEKPPPGSFLPPKLIPNGGQGIWYAASLVILTKRIGKLSAKVDGIEKKFGTKTKLTIEKNHINGIEQAGDFVITPTSIIPDEETAIKAYKDEYKDSWGNVELKEDKS